MTTVNNLPPIPREYEMSIRVRYQETDAQGRVHHSNYANYFEIGRVEMLRSCGRSYRDLEAAGIMLVVTKLTCNYYQGAKYDDLLTLKAIVTRAQGVRITHRYELHLGQELIADGETVVAAINPEGNVVRLPHWLKLAKSNGK